MTEPEVFKPGKNEKLDKDIRDQGKQSEIDKQKKSQEKNEDKETRAGLAIEIAFQKRWDDASKLSAECMKSIGKVENVKEAEAALENIIALPKDHAQKDPKLLNTIGVHAPKINDAVRAQDEKLLRDEMTGMNREIENATRKTAAESADTVEVSSQP